MRSCLVVIAVVALLVAVVHAAISIALPENVPGHEGKCWDETNKFELEAGETRTDRASCEQISCYSDLSMEYTTYVSTCVIHCIVFVVILDQISMMYLDAERYEQDRAVA